MTSFSFRSLALATSALMLTTAPLAPVSAQDAVTAKRIDKLEKEMRAVQRVVFPGGSPTFFEGEIAPDATPGERAAGSTPVADLTARVDALESQLKALTEQGEQNGFKLRELEKQFLAFKADAAKRLALLEAGSTAVDADPATATSAALPVTAKPAVIAAAKPAVPVATAAKPVIVTPAAAKKPVPTPPATAVKPSTERVALVKAVDIPATGNDVDDAYTYGYRLWDAKLYPEAQAQLKKVVERWPTNRLASYAQNLLGRAYLDESKPSLAAVAFYNNYKDRPNGERAPHSLMYMGVSLDRLGRKADACKAFRELEDVYGDRAPKDVRTDAAAAKAKAGC